MTKNQVLDGLRAFCAQRSGINFRNYGDRESFSGDYRPMLRAGADARAMLLWLAGRDGVTSEMLVCAAKSSNGGRLTIKDRDGSCVVDYCVGQYFATEYRAALCRVLAKAIHDHLYCGLAGPDGGGGWQEKDKKVRAVVAKGIGRGVAGRWFGR